MFFKLLNDQAVWQWTKTKNDFFEGLKNLVTTATTLSYFDPKKQTILSVDASPYVIGAVITQDDNPIEFASISLTRCQQRYNHIEKELLALVFGCERFNYYLVGGKQIVLESDYRPLLGFLKKPINEMSPRIQRLTLRLLRYNFNLEKI